MIAKAKTSALNLAVRSAAHQFAHEIDQARLAAALDPLGLENSADRREARVDLVVDDDIVVGIPVADFRARPLHARLDNLRAVLGAVLEPAAQFLDAGGQDEDRDHVFACPLIELLRELISTWSWPVTMASIGPARYFAMHQVFKDRLGAGWILYLPQIIAEDALPASTSIFPVSRAETQLGTLIVSVCDELFDVRNPAHIQAANAIEVSLADLDLLPLHTAL